jgi:diacylglycerol kinase family enzyme
MRGISALFRAYRGVPLPTITPVPAGTVNLCASRWGVRGSADRCFAAALAQKPVRVLRVASLHVQLDGASYVAFTLGAGVVSHFFEAYDESPLPGKWAASRIFARTFVGSLYGSSYAKRILAPVPAHVVIDDGDLGSLALSLLVTSVFTNVGLGLKPTYRAGSEPQRLHLVASTLPTRILGPLAWRVLLGLPLRKNAREPEVIDRMVREFSVRFERPRHVVLDGDAIPSTEARVTCGPELDVALPR